MRSADEGYAELVQEAKDFLSGKSQNVKAHMAEAMNAGCAKTSISSAPPIYRDGLAALSRMQSHQGINPAGVEEADVFAIHHEGGHLLHPGLLLPHRSELGQPRLFPEGRSVAFPAPKC